MMRPARRKRDALVRGPFVITPSVPVLAAPGDEFEVGVTVANNVEGSGENAEIANRAESSEHVQIVKAPSQTLRIAEGREQTAAFSCARERQTRLGHDHIHRQPAARKRGCVRPSACVRRRRS